MFLKMNEYMLRVHKMALTANLTTFLCLADPNSMNIALDDLLEDLWR